MSNFHAILMGIIQGLGEFLPISSSGHLVLAPWLFDWNVPGLTFDVALHMGTLAAVVVYFWKDWLSLFGAAITGRDKEKRRIFWFLVLGSIPAAITGLLFHDIIEQTMRAPVITGIMLIVFAFLLYWADRKKQIRHLDTMTVRDALIIGIAQAVALIPGVSRSGITMTAARWFAFTREEAARFSFLLSTPVIFGAGLVEMSGVNPAEINTAFVLGVLVSGFVGLVSISFLLKFLRTFSFTIFVGYRVILGTVIILLSVFAR